MQGLTSEAAAKYNGSEGLVIGDSSGGLLAGRSSIAADRVIVSIRSQAKTLLVKRQNLTLVFR